MAKKQFKTESKKLLDLMANSIYTNKEIFLRELISNASDALDKKHFKALTDDLYRCSDSLEIHLTIDSKNRTLSIEDNGIGMSKDELEENLGTIAHSGSQLFKQENSNSKEMDIIGQFGVGFYSSFMVSSRVEVESKTVGQQAHLWSSDGQNGYSIDECEKEKVGTKITLFLKDDDDNNKYSDYLNDYHIQELVKKYSDYIRYPITMMVETQQKIEGKDEYQTIEQLKTLNTMIPLWRRNKKGIKQEDYDEFYKKQFYDWEKPAQTIHYSLEGNISYKALMFIPSKAPYNYYSKEYEAGLQLYSKGVFIMDHAKQLIPDYFHFVKGLVDCDDISLNISREMLQEDHQLQSLEKSITKKIKSTLIDLLTKERDKYDNFFDTFGYSLKYGCYQDYGMHKDELIDLLMFKTTFSDSYSTLKEYKERMKEGQKAIYYACGKNIESIKKLPQVESMVDKGFEVLYFTDDVDEFAIKIMHDYESIEFISVQSVDADFDSQDSKEDIEKVAKENEELIKYMEKSLNDKIKNIKVSSRLKNHPVCLVSDEGISLEMEKYLANSQDNVDAKATKILEINPNHPMFSIIKDAYKNNRELVDDYTYVLYQQALLIEGFPVEDPVEYTNKICKLFEK